MRLSDWIVFEIELVEAMEGVLVRVHIEGIDRKVVCCQFERFKHLREG
jgi:hypothetical protein